MFKLSSICTASVILLQLPAAYAQSAPPAAGDMAARIDAAIAPYFKPDAPGASVIVVKDGKTVFRKGYGMADVAKGIPMDAGAQHRIGSVTKQFTSTAILMLADEGKLSVDDDITKYLPDYPTNGKKITIEHLLTHTSGIVSYTSKPGFRASIGTPLTVSGMIDTFKNDPLTFEPGSSYAYNNSGYFLLGAIIEKVSGMSYAQFVEKRIFMPLGMLDTAYEGHEKGKAPRAAGHTTTPAGFAPSAQMSMTLPYAAGSIVSTVDDMARWDAAVSSGKLLKAASWQRAFTPYMLSTGKKTDYGYGWHIGTMQGTQRIAHGGGIPGFSAHAMRLPQEKVYVVVLANNDRLPMSTEVVAARAAAIAIGKPFPDLKPVAVAPEKLDEVAGAYQLDEKTVRTFTREGDKLFTQRGDRPKNEVVAYGVDRFFVPNTLVHMEFARDASGKVNAVTIHQMDDTQTGPRIATK
ncbi:MAG TPA: serine hydrolase [Telluria sp.]|nr:serine hydrolase [Telluria sp.]